MSSANSPDTKKAMAEFTNDDRSGERLAALLTKVQSDYKFTDELLRDLVNGVLEDWTLSDLKSVRTEILTELIGELRSITDRLSHTRLKEEEDVQNLECCTTAITQASTEYINM
ncbi:hypothetical protein SEPCBS57363_006519 [Sporothrix epigloea]|uniref:Uncharacterized protein n=1 Tax=Sporothrix epigloea TaxID=1892477 RepID=A0ABP0E3G1_9PEZI